jgi:hypothetical protein
MDEAIKKELQLDENLVRLSSASSKIKFESRNKIEPTDTELGLEVLKGKKEEQRDNWSGKFDFFFSALSFSVGLGAVWRFPYLCYKNGGGAFLIPFLIFLFVIGIPLMYLELCVGQFTSRGPALSYVMVPIFKGVGLSINLTNNYVNLYYIMVIAYSIYYLILSFNFNGLPWEKCDPKWASSSNTKRYTNGLIYEPINYTHGLINFPYIYQDCVDNFDPAVFTFTKCENSLANELLLKCADGQCYYNRSIDCIDVNCDTNRSLLQRVGYWDPIYPSQDYWKYIYLSA